MKKVSRIKVLQYQLPVAIKKESNSYFAFSPAWQDCYAQGDTIEEAIQEIGAVAASLIELYKEEGLRIPLKATVPKKPVLTLPVVTSRR